MRHLFLILLCLPLVLSAQPFRRSLMNANSFRYRQHCFVYGYTPERNGTGFKIYKLSPDLLRIDSAVFFIGKEQPEDYLAISADTLHHYLNFYFQKTNSKNLASMVRLNDSLRSVAQANNFDVTKVNRLTSFEDEKYWFRNSVYTVRASDDSGGRQYFLNRYDVVDPKKPFEYKEVWQFPLDKKNIRTVHVFYADSEVVMLYATLHAGPAKGQWIIKVNASNGQKIRGKKLNPHDDGKNYLMSDFYYDRKTKQLLVTGNVYSGTQVDFQAKTFNFSALAKSNTVFFTSIDSLMENVMADEKNIPLTIQNVKADPKKPVFYQIKTRQVVKKSESDYRLYCNIYKSMGSELTFLYETGFPMEATISDMAPPEIAFGKIWSNTAQLPNLVTSDPKDINGKLDLKSIADLDRLLYSKPLADVEVCVGKDDNDNPKWVLKKTDSKTGNTIFYKVKIGPKGVESATLLESSKYNYPAVYRRMNDELLIFNSDHEAGTCEVSLKRWD